MLTLAGCDSTTEPATCDGASLIRLEGGACLDLREAGAVAEHRAVLEAEVAAGLAAVNAVMPVGAVRIRVVADASEVIPEVGLGGFNPGPWEIRVFVDPGRPDLDTVLRAELLTQLAHELHHAVRRRSVGYGSTLGEAVVTEGLADHFVLEVAGTANQPWTTALDAQELASWVREVDAAWGEEYDHAAWFFGAGGTRPRWTGYSVGFHMVGQYLQDHPGRLPSDLHDEAAGSFRRHDAG